jgi:hypothetical protein
MFSYLIHELQLVGSEHGGSINVRLHCGPERLGIPSNTEDAEMHTDYPPPGLNVQIYAIVSNVMITVVAQAMML